MKTFIAKCKIRTSKKEHKLQSLNILSIEEQSEGSEPKVLWSPQSKPKHEIFDNED